MSEPFDSVMTDHDQDIIQIAANAMQSGLTLQFEYDGQPRLVEVHAIGISTAGRPCIRGFQVGGSSNSDDPPVWRLFTVRKIVEKPLLLDIKSSAPREGYVLGDKGMQTIFFEFPQEGP